MFVDVNGIRLYYQVEGSGEPLILVHGNGEDHTIFAEAVQKLSRRFTCYLPDSRDHGQSSPVETLNYTDMADDMLAFADALGLEHPSFYGFSDGGIIGLIAAAKQPKRFRRLVVSGANTHPRGVKDSLYYRLNLHYFFNRKEKLRLMLEQPHISPRELRRIACPTLVLAGEHDLIRPLHTKCIAAAIPGAKLKFLPGEDHGSYIVHSTKIADLLLAFANRT